MLRIRLARRGRRNLNAFAIVTAEQSFRRDGRFVEKIGYFQPTLPDSNEFRFSIDKERFDYWVSKGAQPTEKIKKLLSDREMIPKAEFTNKPKKSAPKAKAQEREEERQKRTAE